MINNAWVYYSLTYHFIFLIILKSVYINYQYINTVASGLNICDIYIYIWINRVVNHTDIL